MRACESVGRGDDIENFIEVSIDKKPPLRGVFLLFCFVSVFDSFDFIYEGFEFRLVVAFR